MNADGQLYLKTQLLEPKNPNSLADMPPRMYGQAMYYTQEYFQDGPRDVIYLIGGTTGTFL